MRGNPSIVWPQVSFEGTSDNDQRLAAGKASQALTRQRRRRFLRRCVPEISASDPGPPKQIHARHHTVLATTARDWLSTPLRNDHGQPKTNRIHPEPSAWIPVSLVHG